MSTFTSDHLDRIENSGLIQLAQLEPELEYIFRHALIQETAYNMLVKEQRRSVHAAVAHALETLYPDRLTELAPQLAYHFDEAGDLEKALSYSTAAAEQAASRYANAEASMHYARAIDLAGQLQTERDVLIKLYEGQGRVLQLSGKHEEALTTYLGLELVARERGDRTLELHALMEQSTMYAMLTQQANPEESMRLSERALVIAREIKDEAAEAKILWNISLAHWNMSENMTEAIKFAEESLEIARRLNLREQLAYTLHDLGRYCMLEGKLEQAISAQHEAEKLWRELQNMPMLADSLNFRATLLYLQDDLLAARASCEEALQISREVGNAWGQAMSLQSLAMASVEQGELGRALEEATNAIPAADQAGFRLGSFVNRGRALEIYTYLNDRKRAEGLLVELSDLVAKHNNQFFQAAISISKATFAFRAGNPDPMRSTFETMRNMPRPITQNITTFFDLRQAEFALRLGEYETVVAIAEPLDLRGLSGLQMLSSSLSVMARSFGSALMALGRLKEAHAAFQAAHDLVSKRHAHYQRWELFAAMAELANLESDPDSARMHLAKAREEIEYIAARLGDPELEASFRARPDVAALLAS